jgi:mRNA interferase RelE/StbE
MYDIQVTTLALEVLTAIKDQREQEKLRDRIEQLKVEPEKQGKALVDSLAGLRSVRAVGPRYRIIYKIEQTQVLVIIVGVGRRKQGDKKDIYTVLQKLME